MTGVQTCALPICNARLAMVTMLISGLMNVLLDAVFIFNLGMGVAGAAWATAVSQTLGAVWLAWYYLSGRSVLRLRADCLRPQPRLLAEIVRVGTSAFFNQIGIALTIGFLNNTFARYGGDAGMAAYGIIQRTNRQRFRRFRPLTPASGYPGAT